MKKIIFSLFLLASAGALKAQVITDTVSIGAGYANTVWYSLEDGIQGGVAKTAWDLAFSTNAYSVSIRINTAAGAQLWKYPTADTSGWSTVDTAGLSTWTALYDADSVWSEDAFTSTADPSNQFDYGWGKYNMSDHVVYGDSLFIIKTVSGTYKKLWIENLTGANLYTFKYANLDGSDETTGTLSKSDYSGKNFGYYSFTTNAAADLEPVASSNWNLLFTQYTAFIAAGPSVVPYTVTGVLSNEGDSTVQVSPVAVTDTNYQNQTFSGNANIIGYDWKAYTGGTYVATDSLVYFVKTANKDIWRVVFTGFGGTSTGDYIFNKEKLYTYSEPGGNDSGTSVNNLNNAINSIAVYPNPVNRNSQLTIVYDLKNNIKNGQVSIFDINGRTVIQEPLKYSNGFHNQTVNINGLNAGTYILSVNADGGIRTQKFIVQ